MVAIVTRAGKGSPLTNAEVDANFTNLNNGKLETASDLSDLADASAARTNLGLGSLSTLNAITSLMVTDALGYTPANKAGDTFTGDVVINTKLAVGTSVTASTNYRFGKGLTGGTSSNAFVQNGNVQSDVTTTAVSFNSQANTVAAAFTLTNYFHYYAQQGTIGVGSSVNAMTGFYADNTLAGSTNTYGFRGSVGAGSGKYNLYMDGTANNYLSGNLLIGNLGLANGKVVIGGNMTGQALMSALRAEMTIMSDVTTGARGYQTLFGTEAASWTLPDIIHYRAVQGTFGAGSTVTSQNGFVADASLIGAGTNIGFRGAIPAGSNRWNLYMDGTAQNFIGGNLILDGALGVGPIASVNFGTVGQVLTSAGPGADPTWSTPTSGVTSITAGTGLSGGTITSTGTIALANTAVTAGSYTNASITVDAQGRITAASSGSGGGVTSFNTRTGAVTLSSGDVTGALGYTPYNSSNPSGYITSSGSISGNAATATSSNSANAKWTSAAVAGSQGSNVSAVEVRNNGGTGDSNLANITFHCQGAYGTSLHLRGDGYFGVGGWSASTWRWYVYLANGDMTAAGNVTAYSDERLKKDWAELPEDFVEQLAQIKHGTYTRIDTGERQAGASAQSMKLLLPEVVSTSASPEKSLTLAYGNAALVSAIKLAQQVIELKARLNRLEQKVGA
jgi:hypothetical protein